MRMRPVVAVLAAAAVIAAVGLAAGLRSWDGKLPLPLARECRVKADRQITLTAEQMANAATIAAVGLRMDIPERGVVVALATAYQESGLKNLAYGDRDSVGLFQQRESQGWGSPEQLQDPRYAATAFYKTLRRVKGWRTMRVTDAAQKVQRSAYPEAYQKWADEASVLTKALVGRVTGAVACTANGEPAVRGAEAAAALVQRLQLDWGRLKLTGDPAAGLALAVRDQRAGWRYAHWLVSHALEHGVHRVRYGGMEWSAPSGSWATAPAGRASSADRVVAEVFG